ncbi:hypothetical protein [Paracoccus siganidrum]|uniref:hypothetical protein n=1 Tax=Paracoccus siganidrum TaxID=1276757 RepID=UPI0011C4470C|nr:hypothetical protein [Paracoccus siganidrum]
MLLPLLVLLAGATSAEQAIEPLARDRDGPARRGCTHDGEICLNIAATADGQQSLLVLSVEGNASATQAYDLTAIAPDEFQQIDIWPGLIRFDGGLLAGVEVETSTAYSGGGVQATQLHLIAFLPGKAPWIPLTITIRSSALIRACFSEQDAVNRADVCHDEYDFVGGLSVEGRLQDGMPVLRYKTTATSYPGNVSRDEDSLERPPLRKSDLITVEDPLCSFERVFRIDPQRAVYSPDAPLPDCSNWTAP